VASVAPGRLPPGGCTGYNRPELELNRKMPMVPAFTLSEPLAHYTGPLLSVETPPQGMAFQVFILTAERGSFVLKVARTPAMVRALTQEARILTALHDQVPFVAQLLGEAETEAGYAFLFTYLEGEPLHLALQQANPQERTQLVTRYAQALRCIHGWTPVLPRPADWLSETLAWISARLRRYPPEVLITNTHSRFDGANARHLLAHLQTQRPHLENDLVFGHYDYCLPNVLVRQQQVSGVIDWSGAGYIDRRFDLATALFSMCLVEPVQDQHYHSLFLRVYGYTEPVETLSFFEGLRALTDAFWQ
jgi:aminoglycoside phosphotransferase